MAYFDNRSHHNQIVNPEAMLEQLQLKWLGQGMTASHFNMMCRTTNEATRAAYIKGQRVWIIEFQDQETADYFGRVDKNAIVLSTSISLPADLTYTQPMVTHFHQWSYDDRAVNWPVNSQVYTVVFQSHTIHDSLNPALNPHELAEVSLRIIPVQSTSLQPQVWFDLANSEELELVPTQ